MNLGKAIQLPNVKGRSHDSHDIVREYGAA
jgi:hypothetical protein